MNLIPTDPKKAFSGPRKAAPQELSGTSAQCPGSLPVSCLIGQALSQDRILCPPFAGVGSAFRNILFFNTLPTLARGWAWSADSDDSHRGLRSSFLICPVKGIHTECPGRAVWMRSVEIVFIQWDCMFEIRTVLESPAWWEEGPTPWSGGPPNLPPPPPPPASGMGSS